MRNIFYLLVCICFVSHTLFVNSYSQTYEQKFGTIPVSINNSVTYNGFNGGVDAPRFQMIDIDADGDRDLFVYDKDTTINYYENKGTGTNFDFRMRSARYLNLNIKSWFYFIDIDADGDYDLFTGGELQTMRYFKNTGTPSNPSFTLQINEVRTNTDSTIFCEPVSVPTFADIDGDNDIDFFTGTSIGRVTYYQNIGTQQNFSFKFITSFFAGIEIVGGGMNKYSTNNLTDNLHGASSITFADIDSDNDLDLYWGDYFGESIYFIKNTGSPQSFNWNVIDTTSPEPNPWHSPGYNMPGIFDIDGDGKKDFFVGVLYGSQTKNNFVYYKNNGPVNNPSFQKITENFISCIDVGANSYPAFTDIDNDGDFDLFIGSDHSTVSYYKNEGTQFSVSYNLVTDSLPILKTSFYYAPTFGDIDGDGKKDMLLGAYDGKLRFFKNTGSVSTPVFTFQASQFDTIDVGQSSAPIFADLDNDSDLDLLVGYSAGKLYYYINNGNQTSFSYSLVTNYFQSVSVGNDASPTLNDIDNDGDLDLLVGNRQGKIFFYRNTGNVSSPVFTLVSNNFAGVNVSLYCTPALIDINSDTDKDLFAGNIKGGLYYFENTEIIGIEPINSELASSFMLYQNYPNPFNPKTKIQFSIPSSQFVVIKIFDVTGREVATLINGQLNPGTYEVDFNGSNLASGIYFYHIAIHSDMLSTEGFSDTKKMILLK